MKCLATSIPDGWLQRKVTSSCSCPGSRLYSVCSALVVGLVGGAVAGSLPSSPDWARNRSGGAGLSSWNLVSGDWGETG